MTDQQGSRVPDTHTTTEQPPPEQAATPESAPPPEVVVAGCLYEAGFSTTGPHPQGGVAIARSIDDARQRLADMLIFCDPGAAATADITAFTPAHTVARYSGTVAELFADLNTPPADHTDGRARDLPVLAGTRDRTVHARPLVGLTTPRSTGGR